ncbi:MAG: NAD(P)(+) transhydrogenase (Re/Si-specific) subunit beta [Verrucomicrobiota bacterium]|nr:NAD(P)(+) transhydrogenase (Re/Si-specific) subunit beta [Verrucomicrobiota bacterium]
MNTELSKIFADASYLAAAVLFILGLKALSHPDRARKGMFMAEIGMLLAVVGTLLYFDIVTWVYIVIGVVIGSAIGSVMAIFMPMTAMPQRIALSHAFGALAAVLVGVYKYIEYSPDELGRIRLGAIGFEVLFGALTVTGSLMAFGKLQELIKSAPMTYKGQNIVNITLFFATIGLYVYFLYDPTAQWAFYSFMGLGFLVGIFLVLPIGGADMPVVISLLNSYAGLAIAATGIAIDNKVLIIAGSLDGTSGFFLSMLMSKAMNRSFGNVIFGAVGAAPSEADKGKQEARTVTRYTAEDMKFVLDSAQTVVVIPGYGMAVAQCQHVVHEMANLLAANGTTVRFAIHPVAGRMPGHMNVLLAEANVPYEQLFEMDAINDDFLNTDVVIVVGANDVVNPAARWKKSSPLYGMPILNADKARTVIILKRSMGAGFAGEDNELFYDKKTMMVLGDAKGTLTSVVGMLKGKSGGH